MCSIIGLTGNQLEMARLFEQKSPVDFIKDSLDIKGGDEYGMIIGINGFTKQFFDFDMKELHKYLGKFGCDDNYSCFVLIFSRLTPEMEQSRSSIPQPYYNRFNDTWYAVHGTIPNAEEFGDIKVDTEIFNHAKNTKEAINFVEEQGGKISMIGFNSENYNDPTTYTNGLGMYEYRLCNDHCHIGGYDIAMFSNLDLPTNLAFIFDKEELPNNIKIQKPTTRIISLFSGGLDITCSTWKAIDQYKKDLVDDQGSIDLWYFGWGTNAHKQEVHAGLDMLADIKTYMDNYLTNSNLSIPINHTMLQAGDMFDDVLFNCNMKGTRLTDENAEGAGTHEAEAAVSYVPLRNTFLLTMAAARAEQLYPNDKCIFILGANLSEGMIYLDNSETFINRMNQLVKVAGQSTYNFEVQAPYVNRTKTSMIQDAIEKEYKFKNSFSCYFPKEDKPCGKCGSCLLREEAIKRAENKHE